MIIKNGESITQEFIDILNSVMTRLTEQTDQEEIAQRLGIVYKAVLNYSMKKKMKESKS